MAADRTGDFTAFVSDTLLIRSRQVGYGRPQLWHLPTGRVLGELPTEPPLAVRPDGGLIATVDDDDSSTIDLWTV